MGGTRSWWGWGTVEDAVRGPERAALVARVAAALPGAELVEHEPPDVADLDLPPVRVGPPAALARLCSDAPADRAAHSRGKAFRDVVRNLHGDLRDVPDLVVRPTAERDVVDVLDWCSRAGIAVIPYGGGSSVVGGVEPRLEGDHAGAVSLDLGRLDRVLEVDRTSRAARIQAGVLGPRLEDQLRPHGLTLRFYPQSFEFSSLGGWLATRAGGHFATLHTHVDDLVESLRVVAPAGVGESRRLPASGAGPSPDRLFLGSEGTLGVITEAWMRLQDRPRWRSRASVHFPDYAAAVEATRADRPVRAAPGQLPAARPGRGVPQRRRGHRRWRARARLRVRRPPGRGRAGPGGRDLPGTRRHAAGAAAVGDRRRPRRPRRHRGLAVGVPADAVPAGRAGQPRDDRRRRSRPPAPGTASPPCTPR